MTEFSALVRRELRCHKFSLAVFTVLVWVVAFHDVVWIRGIEASSNWSYWRWLAPYQNEFSLMRQSLITGFLILASLQGIYLGIAQVAVDSLRGLEPFLVHRPISRTRIALAKLSSGVLMISLAFLPAILARAVFTSMPGNHAEPFRWEMIYPAICQCIVGIMLYLAFFWSAAGQGRERFLGIIAIVPAVFFGGLFASSEFGAVFMEVIAATIAALCAVGAIVAYHRRRA